MLRPLLARLRTLKLARPVSSTMLGLPGLAYSKIDSEIEHEIVTKMENLNVT